MKTEIIINNEQELRKFIDFTNTFRSPIDLSKGSRTVDAKSILGVIALGLHEFATIKIITVDENEMVEFINGIKQFV